MSERRPIRLDRLPASSDRDARWEAGGGHAAFDTPHLFEDIVIRRILGYLMDVFILFFLAFGVWMAAAALSIVSLFTLTPATLPLAFLIVTLLPLGYHTWFIGTRGATPGMAMLDVEIRSLDGLPPNLLQAFLQTVVFYATVMPSTWIILIVALFNRRRRCLHDFLAGVVAVRHSAAYDLPAAAS